MRKRKTNSYMDDLLADLKDLDYAATYLSTALSDSKEVFLIALRDVAEAQKGIAKLALEAQVNRENLYRMLSEQGNPRLDTLKAVLRGVGLKITFQTEGGTPVRPAPAKAPVTSRSNCNPTETGEGGSLTIYGGSFQGTPLRIYASGMGALAVTTNLPTANAAAVIGGVGSEGPAIQSEAGPIFSFGNRQKYFQPATVNRDINRNILSAADEKQQEETETTRIPNYAFQLAAHHNLVRDLTH